MASNRGVVYVGPGKVEVRSIDFPKLVDPRGKRADHGVILKIVTTETYTAYREEMVQSASAASFSMTLDGGVGGMVH